MNKNNLFKKSLPVGIIILFIGVIIAPGITVALYLSDATSTKISESANLNKDLEEITFQINKVDGARFPESSLSSREEEVKDTETIVCSKTDNIFRRGIFNFFIKILDTYPKLAGFIEKFIPQYYEKPEELDEPEKPEKPEVTPEPSKEELKDNIPLPAPKTPVEKPPNEKKPAEPKKLKEQGGTQGENPLELTLNLNKTYKEGEPISVIANLTNIGDVTLVVSEMNFRTGTLDFYIDTPDGYQIHFIYPTNDSGIRYWTIKPKESKCIDMDITSGLFGVSMSPSNADFSYKFKEGCYTIVGYYKSYHVEMPIQVGCNLWEGELNSPPYKFEIIPK